MRPVFHPPQNQFTIFYNRAFLVADVTEHKEISGFIITPQGPRNHMCLLQRRFLIPVEPLSCIC
ncbi:MAG: hypothetical protein CBC23_006515 [Rhodospirillaceae bacterium TMED63]|nr:MAG: hypothetical protein CBC23_006515 [Rhodospirillaceae bacterium TMED63]